ncbi:enoyl-CoA hydratase-related protein [uncultured Cycloclasticus sp.]|uniref:enoyl-CoA hydratase/isomerase family protein n=1 Tax=uncultured Cycloclasticus sp. TaxID=172194 RepID=UPI002582ADE1|nr:enoyl-CoA hydratase-related protein [uncultured Cycloclasticus sp.]
MLNIKIIRNEQMSSVLVEKKDGVAWLILNRPEKLNVVGSTMPADLLCCTEELKNDESIKCVIVTGAGDHFMAGGDIDYFKSLVDAYAIEGESALPGDMFDNLHQAILNLVMMEKPVIACVKGAVAGFGLSLMLACDMVVAADNSVFSVAYCKIGTTPDGGMSYFLPRAVGQKRALELSLTGQRFSAEQAERWGMVNRVVAVELLETESMTLAESLCKGPKDVLARTKRLFNQTYETSLKDRLNEEADNFFLSMLKEDFVEGVTSFCEKRPAIFKE